MLSLLDDLGSDSNDESAQEIDIEKWSKSPEIIGCFKCQEIKSDGSMCPRSVLSLNDHIQTNQRVFWAFVPIY